METLKRLRKLKKLTQKELGLRVGCSESAISQYESGKRSPDYETLLKMAEELDTSANYLLTGEDDATSFHSNFLPMPEMHKIPRVGRIACGEPIIAEENIETYDETPKEWHADFSLLCVGNSMSPKIEDGDIVAIRRQVQITNGEIAAVRIGDEATLKMVYIHPDYVELRPVNPSYPSIIRRREEMNDIRIEGKAVGLCRNL